MTDPIVLSQMFLVPMCVESRTRKVPAAFGSIVVTSAKQVRECGLLDENEQHTEATLITTRLMCVLIVFDEC